MARKLKTDTQQPVEAPKQEQELTPLELHALALISKRAKKVRDNLQGGTGQMVHFTLEVSGALDVNDGKPAKVTQELDAETMLAVLLDPLPASTRKKYLAHVAEACDEWATGGAPPIVSEAAKACASELLESGQREALQPRRGAVTGSIKHTLVQRGQRPAA
jgi:hypothetical protein